MRTTPEVRMALQSR
ncbi:hypothetical protein AVEN_181529-1, partial [Araneus ventricosus]